MLVLTDDQGYGDLSAHGNPVLQTPHLDRLQAESLRFTDFLVSPTCSPTRAALMTGRHEFANGVAHTIYERERLTLAATTIAQTYPGSCGDAPDNGYFDPALLHNGTFEKTEGYCTDLFFRQAFQWIEAQATAEKPFFASIATNAPHAPSVARPEDRTRYEGRGRLNPSQQNFFGMIHNIDENVGRLVNRLDELGIAETPLVGRRPDAIDQRAGRRAADQPLPGTLLPPVRRPADARGAGTDAARTGGLVPPAPQSAAENDTRRLRPGRGPPRSANG